MGKWTTQYYDDVLGAKMRSLVSGAIKRARLEKAEPSITYEAFVEDLDRGDSFTTSLVEVLVKEVAERRYRSHAADRGLIADRTARSLRKLSSPASVYRERGLGRGPGPGPALGLGPRRGVDLAEYLSQPPDELDVDEDEDELVPYSAFVPIVEGSRLNPELYDAYRQHSPPADGASDRALPPLVDGSSPPTRTGMWPLSTSTNGYFSTLSRQPSIRRPGRNRMSDFNEFTALRRNLTRPMTQDEEQQARETMGGQDVGGTTTTPAATNTMPLGLRPGPARRFFPFGRARRFEVIPTPRPAMAPSDDWYFPPHPGWTVVEEAGEERTQAPRLRRGGLRAPEMVVRHSSPPLGVPEIAFPTPEELQRVAAAGVRGASASATATAAEEGEGERVRAGVVEEAVR